MEGWDPSRPVWGPPWGPAWPLGQVVKINTGALQGSGMSLEPGLGQAWSPDDHGLARVWLRLG